MNQQEAGLYHKFNVTRTDARDQPGGDRQGAEYFVLDQTFDPYAVPALLAYADACREGYSQLSSSIIERVFAPQEPQRDENGWWCHPAFNWQSDESFNTKEWLAKYDREIYIAEMDWAENCDELFEALEKTGSVCGWLPLKPDGYGWYLVAIYDTEDGPAAAWIRVKLEA